MSDRSNSADLVWVGLTPAQAKFVVENADANITMGLTLLQSTNSRDSAEKLVAMIDAFKEVKKAVKKAES